MAEVLDLAHETDQGSWAVPLIEEDSKGYEMFNGIRRITISGISELWADLSSGNETKSGADEVGGFVLAVEGNGCLLAVRD
jgi:hypothetical protein